MDANERTYCCIDLKSFYASVECVERGLDPFEAPLVVADPERGSGTICLAVSPALKAKGVSGRPRIYELPEGLDFITAPPRMQLYMEKSAEIVGIYLNHVSPQDLHIYSIDECFIDLTPYLLLDPDPLELVRKMRDEVMEKTKIPSTAGIGTNLFQAKVALDILAKRSPDGVAVLDDALFRELVWPHRPITDVWGIGRGISRRLARYGIYDLEGITHASIPAMYREFGVNAEYLIDHAWGLEPCTIEEIRNYKPKGHSIGSGQLLMRDYLFDEARRVVREEVEEAVLEMVDAGMVANGVSLHVGYAKESEVPHAGGSRKLAFHTDSMTVLAKEVDSIYVERVQRGVPIRRLNVALHGLMPSDDSQPDLFVGAIEERDRSLSLVMNAVIGKFGRGKLMHGTSFMPGATGLERATLIGGHRAR